MADSYKDIIITPNRGNTADPKIEFRGANSSVNTSISLHTYHTSNGTLSFEGSAGQLFSITNDLSGSIFSVNDVSGIPSIEVFANGVVSLAEYNGNVGIGTSSPTAKLSVDGSVVFNESGADVDFRIESDTNTHAFFVQGSDGNVGIGTTAPGYKLSVQGNAIFADDIYLRDGSTTSGDILVRIYDSSDDGIIDVYRNNAVVNRIHGNGSSYFNAGNVGIGTASPTVLLDVVGAGSALFTNTLYHMRSRTATSGQGMLFGYHTGTGVGGLIAGDAVSGSENNLIIGGYNGSSWGEVMRVKGGGTVGIGQPNPVSRLRVDYPFSGSTATTLGKVSESHIHLGAPGYNNQFCQITFGYDTANAAAAIAFVSTAQTGQTYGEIRFATRNTTNSVLPTQRMRLDRVGDLFLGAIEGLTTGNAVDEAFTQLNIVGRSTTKGGIIGFFSSGGGGRGLIEAGNTGMIIVPTTGTFIKIGGLGIEPLTDNSIDLGSTGKRWRNIYTGDLNLSNKDSQNDIDGTWGNWTIQEGENDLYLINKRNGKKFKFMLKEVE